MFDDLGHFIGQEQGLKSLNIEQFSDKNTLQEWPLGQLVLKCHHLQSLKICQLLNTTQHNRNLLIEFAGQVATYSSSLHTLHIKDSRTR